MDTKTVHIEMRNLIQTELQRLKNIVSNRRSQQQHLATLKRLKRGDENELERKLRLDKVVARKQLRLAMETEEERRARLENYAATKRLRLAMEREEVRRGKKE